MKPKHTLISLCLAILALCSLRAEPLEIWISSQQDKQYYDAMVELYRQTGHPDFEAKISAFGFREMPDKLAVAFKTKTNAPDVVQLDEVLFGSYLRDESPFVDLTQRVRSAGLDETIVPQRLDLFKDGDRILGVPQSLSAMILYYRRDLFEKNGLSIDYLQTWQDVLEIGSLLAERGQSFLAMDPSYFEIFLRQRGSDLFGKDGEVLPDPELAADTLDFMSKLISKGIGVLPDRGSIFDPVFFSGDVENGEVLAIVGGDWYGLDMIQQFASHQAGLWGVAPLPAWLEVKEGADAIRTSTFAGQGLLIYKESKQIDEAWDFIQFVMTNKEANAQRFLDGNSFPAYEPSFSDERLLGPSPFFGGDSMGQLLVDLAPDIPRVAMDPRRPMAVFMLREGLLNSALYGQMTAKEALQQFKTRLESGSVGQ